MDEIMVITGLVGALVASSYKWGYFVFAMFALFFIAYNVCYVAQKHARAIGPNVSRTFLICGVWTIFLWFLYPIAWGLSEGGNVIAPDSEAVFYGVLDIMAKPVFGALLLWGHRNIDPATLGLNFRDYDDPIITTGTHHSEKHAGIGGGAAQTHNNGVNTGVVDGQNTTTTGTGVNDTVPTSTGTHGTSAV